MTDDYLPATTTEEQSLTLKGQRNINIIWESTQALISIVVTGGVIYTSIAEISATVLHYAFFLIIGFYYARTNHANIGGIGPKPTERYIGR